MALSAPKPDPMPAVRKMSDTDVQAALAAERERARRRAGRSQTIIAGLYPDQPAAGTMKQSLGG